MKKATIAIDIDDVLADYAAGFVAFSNEKWGTNLTVEDYDEHWAKVWNVENDEIAIRAQQMHDDSLVKSLRHKDDAVLILERLSKQFELIIVTSRRTQNRQDTLEWLNLHYPMIDTDNVTFAGFWDTIDHESITRTKGDIAAKLGASYIIDDQPKHCISAVAHGMKGLLFGDYAWNRDAIVPNGVTRVKSWAEVEEFLLYEARS